MKYLFGLDTLICTGFIAGIIFIFTHIPVQTDLFDPIAKAFEDFEVSDLVFSQPAADERLNREKVDYIRDPHKITRDTNVVLVNIQFRGRQEIAQMLEIINRYQPKVVGIDAFFRKEKDPGQDFPLAMAMAQTQNLVLVSELVQPNEAGGFDSIQFSNPLFTESAHSGFANVIASTEGQGFRTVKSFYPKHHLKDSLYPNFSTKIVELADPEAYQKLIDRHHFEEVINWKGNYRKFTAFDAHQILNEIGNLNKLTNKIVLLGYIGPQLGDRDLVDIFYTPQNPRVAGRSYPDTYGVVVHANIISMIMDERYIHQMPDWVSYVLIFLVTYLNVALFLFIADHKKTYYDLITKSIQLLELALFMFVIVILMLLFNIKVHLSLLFAAIALSGDLTELYYASLRKIAKNLISGKKEE